MKLEHCHCESCVQIIESLRKQVEELTYRPESVLMRMAEQLAAMTKVRDELKQTISILTGNIDDLSLTWSMGEIMVPISRLSASQAREAKLREALEDMREFSMGSVQAALDLPQDDTALRQYGAKLLRDAAAWLGRHTYAPYAHPALYLNRIADELETGK